MATARVDALDMAEIWLRRAEWQPVIFAEELRRLELLRLEPTWPCATFRLRVHRNQAFEFVASVLGPFLAFAGRQADVVYSDYDDSLALTLDGPADVELLWLDFDRYGERLSYPQLASWLAERLRTLRAATDAPILVADSPGADAAGLNRALREALASLAGVRIVPVSEVTAPLSSRAFDQRAARVTGMPLSSAACLHIARALGLVWIPAALGPGLKAVVVDLDHTLYAGVLGEDGPSGVRLSPAHAHLQRQLLRLRDQGLYLAVASRNEPEDVDRLFTERADLPLRPEHLSARAVSFRDKAAGIEQIGASLRIAPDAMLFLDDNPGEIAAVASAVPGLKMLHAADPALAARALDHYPGLHGYPHGRDDALRVADLAAAEQRARAAASAPSPAAYVRSLEVVLTLSADEPGHLERMAALSGKTNQFNTALLRLTEAQVAKRLCDPRCRTISIALRDRLSDSGIVGGLFARHDGDTLVVDEIVISCRALGRGIEEPMITAALLRALRDRPAREVRFTFREGPRNDPARRFLAAYAGLTPGSDAATLAWDDTLAARSVAGMPLAIVESEGP